LSPSGPQKTGPVFCCNDIIIVTHLLILIYTAGISDSEPVTVQFKINEN